MTDAECVDFLQWALPRLGLRYPGFRKVRRQVCKRIARRVEQLGLSDTRAYKAHLEAHSAEWQVLDALCHVTISRFLRDRAVFGFLVTDVLPVLAANAGARGDRAVTAWSAGCASGEEPYTLALVWLLGPGARLPGRDLRVLATDVDEAMLRRARAACYPDSSLRELPTSWREQAFSETDGVFCLVERFRRPVTVRRHDVRTGPPDGPFDLVLCRNLAFTYFDDAGQRRVCELLAAAVRDGGALVVGSHETLPAGQQAFVPWSEHHRVYRRLAAV